MLVFLDWLFRFGLPVRSCLLTLWRASGSSAFLGVRAFRRWRASRLDELSLAMTLDRFRPGVGQQVADVLQLPDLLDEPGAIGVAGDGPAGRSAGVRGAGRVRLATRSGTAGGRRCMPGALVAGLLVPSVFGLVAPHAARLSVARWLLGSSERWPQRTYLTVMGLDARGRLVAPRDERFSIEVRSDLPMIEPRGDGWIGRRPGRAALAPAQAREAA